MRGFGIYCAIGVVLAGSAACGGGKTEEAKQAAATTQEAAKEPAGGGEANVAKGMEEFAKAMEQMQQSPDGKAYEPVSFKELQGYFPDVSGWEKEKPTGESMTAPVRFSQAETAYTQGDARIEVKIVDTAMSRMLTMPYQMFLMTGYQKETDTGYEKAAKVGGNPGWEKWDSEAKRAELGVIVGQRFLVTAEGSGTDVKTVQGVIGKMDLEKLAGLK
ncbi:MAG: hypothetical protein MUE61_06225 [Vicinamibacterales bacterium]|jgi:hypothetical protein|nr:hypothetical protein [Vicinamibacterales bacterium]